jgi:peroxiredoxin
MTRAHEQRLPRWVLALLSGPLLALSFPGSGDQAWTAFVALVPLLAAVGGVPWRRVAILGFGAGLAVWFATIPHRVPDRGRNAAASVRARRSDPMTTCRCAMPRSSQPTWRSLAFVAAVVWVSVASAVAPALAAEELAAMDLGPPPQPLAAPDFNLPTLSGGTMALNDLRGKPIVVHFWTTWCQPCKYELPLLEKFYREHKARGVVVLGITVDASVDVVRKYLAERDFTFPVLLDPDYAVADQFRLRGLPGTFIVGRDGYIKGRGHGPREWDSPAARKFADWLVAPR